MESPSTGSADESQQQAKSLNVKYQKLAAEYAKLRSQVQVLKKAVVDEKDKHEVLKETVTTQDQSIRKLEQELDSVKFRNRQLEKRIEVLQETQGHKSTTPLPQQASHHHQNTQQFDSNLLVHVEQNKVLQEQLALMNEKYSAEVGRLRRMIDFEMVPKELMESVAKEGGERVGLLNRRVAELVEVNSELRGVVEGLEVERSEKSEGGSSGGSMEVDELVRRLTESELGREKLGSEVQILRLKLKKVNSSCEGVVRSPSSSVISSPVDTDNCNMLGRVVITTDGQCDDSELVVTHLRERVNELIRLLQISDSKAVHYYSEAVNLCRLVRSGQVSYKRLDGEFGKLKGRFKAVCEELEGVKGVYERQVDSLTEHVGMLNEKLAGVVEEVTVLRGGGR